MLSRYFYWKRRISLLNHVIFNGYCAREDINILLNSIFVLNVRYRYWIEFCMNISQYTHFYPKLSITVRLLYRVDSFFNNKVIFTIRHITYQFMIELKDNFNFKKIHCYTSNSLFSYRVAGNLTQKLKKKILCPLVTIPTVYLLIKFIFFQYQTKYINNLHCRDWLRKNITITNCW